MKKLDRSKIINALMAFGEVKALSIGSHFAVLITGNGLDRLKTYNEIQERLKNEGIIEQYPNIQACINESDFFLLTLNK